MATDHSDEKAPVQPRKLWFGFATGAAAWVLVGIAEIFIEWGTCVRYGQSTVPPGHTLARVLCLLVTISLLVVAVISGVISYRNWQKLTEEKTVLSALAEDRREFMAVMGLFVSLTMGAGILWQAFPALIITLCERSR